MDLLWYLMKANGTLKKYVPSSLLRKVRNFIDSRTFLWKKAYYSQFGEDAVLQGRLQERAWQNAAKCKKNVGPHRGFYVDVGAFAPIQHSSTFYFYKDGWRGINIDATPGSMRLFRKLRPRDVNLESAISNREGLATYYTWGGGEGIPNVCNTMVKEQADDITSKTGEKPTLFQVPVTTLAKVLNDHLPQGQRIDFLNVDVEGHSLEVLESNDWLLYRPVFVLVESNDEDKDDMNRIINSAISRFLRRKGYALCCYVKPTLIFEQIAES